MQRSSAITIRVQPDVKLKIERLARADGRTVSSYLERLIVQHLHDVETPPKAEE